MCSLVAFEDLGLLDGPDLKAVFGQVPTAQVLDALAGVPAGLRRQLLARLPQSFAAPLAAQLLAREPATVEASLRAQQAVVSALYRLSRVGQVAFHVPEDMVA